MKELLTKIGMPDEVVKILLPLETNLSEQMENMLCRLLCESDSYEYAHQTLVDLLGADKGGFRMLKVMMKAALLSHERYKSEGIDDQIFYDTMGCFSRFVKEHKQSFGTYGFDRGFWTGHQLSLVLFRIGTLEYEICDDEISLHIPSDADLSDAAVERSLCAAKKFLLPRGKMRKNIYCTSWLLSPYLTPLLSPSSRIRAFQKRFELIDIMPDDESYKLWLFKNGALRAEDFPEETSLQRAVKAHVLAGGIIGDACGKLLNF